MIYHFKSVFESSDNKLWSSHFAVPKDIYLAFKSENVKRFLCNVNSQIEYPCGIQHFKKEYPVIAMNKTIQKKLKINYGDTVEIELQADNSEFGMPLSEEMNAVLEQDTEGNEYFQKLTKGKQRSLIYLINSQKNSDAKIQKSFTVLEHLKMNGGSLDYKQLYEMLKKK